MGFMAVGTGQESSPTSESVNESPESWRGADLGEEKQEASVEDRQGLDESERRGV
jgi:hypothetical protein